MLAPFDGIGATHYLIHQEFGTPLLAVSWEVDRACHNVQEHRTPWVQRRGDITKDDSHTIASLVHKADPDPDAHATVIWVAAPRLFIHH